MSEHTNQDQPNSQPRKVNLAEAMKNKLKEKQQQNKSNNKNNAAQKSGNMSMKHQNHKQTNMMRRKTGGS